jgi:hypothetical protein
MAIKVSNNKQTRVEILRCIASNTGLKKAQVESVFVTLGDLLHFHMRKRGSGEFIIPMIGIKVRRVKTKAMKSRKMVSPLTGKEVVLAAKPARMVIRLKALQPLKVSVLN